jgi:DNA-binding NtrC family response regulator
MKGRQFQDAKRDVLARFERDYFAALAEEAKGNVSEMARRAGMERAHVRAYLRRHGIGAKQDTPE